jgi:hypothetical protein
MDMERAMHIVRSFFLSAAALLLMTGIAYAADNQFAKNMTPQPVALTAPTANGDASVVMAPMALNSLSNPPAKIATAPVADESGTVVGAVQKVELDAGGKPVNVEIALLGSNRIVVLDSGQLSYDVSNNVVTAALDKSQLANLPPAPQG